VTPFLNKTYEKWNKKLYVAFDKMYIACYLRYLNSNVTGREERYLSTAEPTINLLFNRFVKETLSMPTMKYI